MKHNFLINGKSFECSDKDAEVLKINSHPRPYCVYFDIFSRQFPEKTVVLVDQNVKNLYNINHPYLICIESIEENKNINTVLDLCDKLMSFNFDKSWTLYAIGGGIIQDIAAFASKIFKRGIDWVFVPTTLLSQCDSCIGGKTALNFNQYKNQLALYSAPKKVIIDVDFLKSLSHQDIISGYGEIVKLFLIGGQFYVDNINNFSLRESIFHSLAIKKAVIEADEFENLERKSLNYGHSFGHAIEAATNYAIPHGEAVLLGIEIINKLFTNSKDITKLISGFTSLDKIKNIESSKLIASLKTDKKISAGKISFVVVDDPGNTIFIDTVIDEKLENKVHEIFAH
jgi:3-dehydroquinate synthase